jgi:hypothetical protein
VLSAAVVGPRTRETAQEIVAASKARGAGSPAGFSNGFTCSRTALIAAFHIVVTCAHTGKRGRTRLTLSTGVVLGAERLTHLGLALSTAVVERVHLTVRQALAPLGRQTSSFGKARERLRQRVVFLQACYHVARPPMSWRWPWPLPERTRHGAIGPRWQEGTPAMAAGVTDHVWTFRELLQPNLSRSIRWP